MSCHSKTSAPVAVFLEGTDRLKTDFPPHGELTEIDFEPIGIESPVQRYLPFLIVFPPFSGNLPVFWKLRGKLAKLLYFLNLRRVCRSPLDKDCAKATMNITN